ncbi:unnamed protein product [Linum trigynum]|uniref:Uncharacterized protein n=1 Tax=Linum trigynum TaxID=586398 RepID=A0AAV2EXE5_9ROSI
MLSLKSISFSRHRLLLFIYVACLFIGGRDKHRRSGREGHEIRVASRGHPSVIRVERRRSGPGDSPAEELVVVLELEDEEELRKEELKDWELDDDDSNERMVEAGVGNPSSSLSPAVGGKLGMEIRKSSC